MTELVTGSLLENKPTKHPVTILPRHKINTNAWNACVAASPQRIVYGYSWYLDTVLPAPFWKWVGLVLADDSGHYLAVMPIPLRRKHVLGVRYSWVVHQPFFCQVLGVFSTDEAYDPTPFLRVMQDLFRYGATVSMRQRPAATTWLESHQATTNQVLDLGMGYDKLYRQYTRDRKQNLKRALSAGWTVTQSTEPEPLLTLFRENHTDGIDGGVAEWAYDLFRNLVQELTSRGLVTIRYAVRDGCIEAGALFVCDDSRIIYLFNAAAMAGRQGNARTLLIDQIIQEKAGKPLIFDFESPAKLSIRRFYQSFGTMDEPIWILRWNRLTRTENALRTIRRYVKKRS